MNIIGDADIAVDGKTLVEGYDNMEIIAQKDLNIKGGGDIKIEAKKKMILTAKKIIENG